jgi:hypothetical protein
MAEQYQPLDNGVFYWTDLDGRIVAAGKVLGRGVKDDKPYIRVATWDTWAGQIEDDLSPIEYASWRSAINKEGMTRGN